MTILGSDVHGKIRHAIARQKTAEAELSERLYDCERRIARLVADREEAFTRLAQRTLPELNAGTVKNALREVQSDVEKIYLERQARRQTLEREMADATARRAELDARLAELEGRRGAKAEEIERLKQEVLSDLRAHPQYSDLRRSLSAATDEHRRSDSVHSAFLSMAGAKARDYESNRVFAYLSGRGYGTPAYRPNAFTRALDAWAALKIDYLRQKSAYDVLRHGGTLLEEQTARAAGRLHNVQEQAKAVEREIAGRRGLLPALEEARVLDGQRTDLLGQISAATQDWERKTQERADLDSTKGSHHVQALDRLKAFLKGEEIATLKTRVAPEDQGTVERIGTIDHEIRILKKDARGLQQEQAVFARRLRELHAVESHVVSRNYDGRGARFTTGLDVDAFLIGCLAGTLSSGEFCLALDRHRYVPSAPPSFSSWDSSSSFSSSDGGSSSSSFGSSSGGGGGGGSGGDGGFSTGGGF